MIEQRIVCPSVVFINGFPFSCSKDGRVKHRNHRVEFSDGINTDIEVKWEREI